MLLPCQDYLSDLKFHLETCGFLFLEMVLPFAGPTSSKADYGPMIVFSYTKVGNGPSQ
jgi:hypothetical protein